jgi:ribosome-associated protein
VSARWPLPDGDLQFSFVRGSGPGGQNVNKVASAAQLRFDLAGNATLDAGTKARLRQLAGRRCTDDGAILIIARNHRTQEGNRRDALERLRELVERAGVVPKARRATRPTRASVERRIASKGRQQRTKALRRSPRGED